MKWATIEQGGRRTFGLAVDDGFVSASRLFVEPPPTLREAIAGGRLSELPARLPAPDISLSDALLLPPVPDPAKIICAGMNYRLHREEMKSEAVPYPTLFTRFADTQIGSGAPVPLPTPTAQLDYEGELAVIIGRALYRANPAEIPASIAGYACYNDFSVRDWQFHTSQWLPGKNFPGTGAFGPWFVTADDIPDVSELWLETSVNGECRQRATVADLIFSIADIICYASAFTPLSPGDVIVTGTPAGVGMRMTPPTYLEAGDVVTVTIDRLGTLENTVVNQREPDVADDWFGDLQIA